MKNKVSYLYIFLSIIVIFITYTLTTHEKNKISIKKDDAINEINAIHYLLKENSPYYIINKKIVDSCFYEDYKYINTTSLINKENLRLRIEKSLGYLKDRHANVKLIQESNIENEFYLPFSVAPFNNEILALKENKNGKFTYFLEKYPYLKKIETKPISHYLQKSVGNNTFAPEETRLYNSCEKLYELYNIQELNKTKKIKFTFTNFNTDTILSISLSKNKTKWKDLLYKTETSSDNIKYINYNEISYIRIPEMYDIKENTDIFLQLERIMEKTKKSKALIIDVRNNSGGSRDLISFFSTYLVPPNEIFISNIALLKKNIEKQAIDQLNSRNLYSYNQYENNIQNKRLIQNYLISSLPINHTHLCEYKEFYFSIIKNKYPVKYLNKSIYILANEKTFSAASIFVSTFKGVKKIKIAGVCTDGSSGLSKSYTLKYTTLNFSHMLSFQKDNNFFDGLGTHPDIKIERDINQIFLQEDTQLNTLIKIANQN